MNAVTEREHEAVSEPASVRLTGRQRRFVREYLKCFNAAEAAERAGYAGRSKQRGFEALRLTRNVRHAIEAALAERTQQEAIERARLIKRFEDVVYIDPRALFHSDGSAKRIDELDAATAAAVEAIDITEEFTERDGQRVLVGRNVKIRLVDRIPAMRTLAEILHLVGPSVRFQISNNMLINVSQIPKDPQEAARTYARLVGGNGT